MAGGAEVLNVVNDRVEDAVRGLLAAVRAQWRAFWPTLDEQSGAGTEWAVNRFEAELQGELQRLDLDVPGFSTQLSLALIAHVGGAEFLSSRKSQSHALLQATLGSLCPGSDLAYFAVRELRRRFDLTLSSESAWLVRHITEAANVLLQSSSDGRCRISDPQQGIIPRLLKVLESSSPGNREGWRRLPEFFLEFLGVLDLARPTELPDTIQLVQRQLSSDAILSQLFGVPTEIQGFDALVGGGGLMLADTYDPPLSQGPSYVRDDTTRERIGGRIILTTGQFGSGKSLLTLQFAIEVARKGGIAWVMALEQSVEECLFSIESLGISIHNPRFWVLTDLPSALDALADRHAGVGALVFLKITEPSYVKFLEGVEEKLSWMQKYPLRLLVIDPINGLVRPDNQELRARTMQFFHAAKNLQVNLWITCERQESDQQHERFEENIADTVLHVGVESSHHHQQRFIEVTKSRLQREQSGAHTLVIHSGTGVRIYPSSASVSSAGTTREYSPTEEKIDLGVTGFQELLGEKGIFPGDLIGYYGATGTSKTLCGIHFLLESRRQSGPGRSLFVADFGQEWMEQQVKMAIGSSSKSRQCARVFCCAVAPGYIAPGEILELIADELSRAHRDGDPYDRVLLTNLTRWILGMPFLSEDPVFAIALINLLRRHSATAVIVLAHHDDSEADVFSKLILDHADCVVRFRRILIRGQSSQVIDVQKTRTMGHRRDAWELLTDDTGPRVEPSLALLRIDAAGNVKPVPIALHLHSDTPTHVNYNLRVLSNVQAALYHEARLEDQERSYDPNILPLVASSAIDELQVLQLDEFQLPREERSASSKLREFSMVRSGKLIEERLKELRDQVIRSEGQGFIAVPFYTNIGLLAYRKETFPRRRFPENWDELAGFCAAWEERNAKGLFFACHVTPANNFETYNCLFLEILYSLTEDGFGRPGDRPSEHSHDSGGCELLALLSKPEARQAARILWTLCHRSHAATVKAIAQKGKGEINVQPYSGAHVWRHWFSTLTQMLETEGGVSPAKVNVRPLYGPRKGGYTTTAGEWYLGVPAHSAAHEVGLEIIRFLTTPEREIQRMNLGVGLPTRADYYDTPKETFPKASVSKYFHLHPWTVGEILANALRRSNFSCYQLFTETISVHLRTLLEVTNRSEVEGHIQSTLENLHAGINYMRHHDDSRKCSGCRGNSASVVQVKDNSRDQSDIS